MKYRFSGSVALVALIVACPAVAADMPVKAPVAKAVALFNWTGCHAGINGGLGWGADTGERDATTLVGVGLEVTPSTFGLKPNGIFGGGQVGCNLQHGGIVFGWEADIQGSGIGGRANQNLASGLELTASTAQHTLDWFGTIRGRVGFTPTPELLLYVTGGLAYGELSDRASVRGMGSGLIGTFSDAVDGNRIGWTVGGGGELALSPRDWSFKAEYLYVDLGSRTLHLANNPIFPASFIDYEFEHRYHIVRVGLNYRFGVPGKGPLVARY